MEIIITVLRLYTMLPETFSSEDPVSDIYPVSYAIQIDLEWLFCFQMVVESHLSGVKWNIGMHSLGIKGLVPDMCCYEKYRYGLSKDPTLINKM